MKDGKRTESLGVVDSNLDMSLYLTVTDYAEKHGRPVSQIRQYIKRGLIKDIAKKTPNGHWLIQKDAKCPETQPEGYISAQEYAEKHGRVVQQIKQYLKEGRIEGAMRFGNHRKWLIPEDAPYPEPLVDWRKQL